MTAKEIIDKLKVLLGMAEEPKPAEPEAPAEQQPAEAKPEEQPAETAVEQPAEEKPAEETKLAEESEQKPEGEEEKPAEQPAPAPEEVPVEKRVADLEAKFDEMFGLLQKLAEREAKVETDEPAPASATPAHFAKQEQPKPLTKAERIIALKNNQL